MSMNQARFGLMGIFVGSLAVHLVALFVIRTQMWPADFQALMVKLLGIYSVQLGVVLGGIFAQPKAPLANPPIGLSLTAIVLAVLWNLLLVSRFLAFCFAEQDSVGALIQYLDSVAASSSFLVAGVVVFFFGKGTEPAGSAQ
jgi:hypothetical protein